MEKYKGKYRIESNRLRGWDYSSDAMYFITIVTANREYLFGEIINEQMVYNEFGKIANDEWMKSFKMRKELFLDEYIIMPNHLHAILLINNDFDGDKKNIGDSGTVRTDRIERTEQMERTVGTVETHGRASLLSNHPEFQRKPKSISSFVAGYKSAVLNKIDDYIDANNLNVKKYNRNNPLWQSNYHDHIIRDDASYHCINNYIVNNPKNWCDDKLHVETHGYAAHHERSRVSQNNNKGMS